jgi:predicted tellurium resistance membrane protein TerC
MMKNFKSKYFFSFAILFISFAAMAQKDTNSIKAFKDIHKIQDTDRHLEKEIKKKELQKAPSLLYLDSSKSQAIKKEKCRRKKKTNH